MSKTPSDQAKRFEEMAREVGADASGEEFERAFGKIVPPKRRRTEASVPKARKGKQ